MIVYVFIKSRMQRNGGAGLEGKKIPDRHVQRYHPYRILPCSIVPWIYNRDLRHGRIKREQYNSNPINAQGTRKKKILSTARFNVQYRKRGVSARIWYQNRRRKRRKEYIKIIRYDKTRRTRVAYIYRAREERGGERLLSEIVLTRCPFWFFCFSFSLHDTQTHTLCPWR
ncbi:hypothetical protein HOY82DRAFT_353745 [Tuber indicum]|nr:hypothetical protein HOY82DRAFT_353745 [Tuber indicum]